MRREKPKETRIDPGGSGVLAGSSLARLSAWQLVVLAVDRCGGATRSIDTEDVAVAVHAIAPGRFSWRKHRDQINLEHVRVALSDAKKAKHGTLLTGSGDEGWMLTSAGKSFVDSSAGIEEASVVERRLSTEQRRWLSREESRLREHPCVQACLADPQHRPEVAMVESVFRLDSYVTGVSRRRKVDRLLNMLGGDPDLGPVLRRLDAVLQGAQEGG